MISLSAMWPIISWSMDKRAEARTPKPVEGVVVEDGGNQVLYLWAKARALNRAALRSGEKAL